MSRSGYYGCEDTLAAGRWRAQVASAIRGARGQKFLRELAQAMDAMPEKALITGQLITPEGDCCAMGVICKARGLDISQVNQRSMIEVGALIDVAQQLAAEIAFKNDDLGSLATPEERWLRMRKWVESLLRKDQP